MQYIIDSPGLEKKNTSDVDRRDGGLYIITDICHKIDSQRHVHSM